MRPGRRGRWVWLLLPALLLGGCWSRREINEIAIPLALGIDLEDGGGYLLTIQVARPPTGGGAATGSWLETARGASLDEATQRMRMQLGKELRWHFLAVAVFGRQAAEAGVEAAMDYLLRVLVLRETAAVVVAETSARELLAADTPSEPITGLGLAMILSSSRQSGQMPRTEVFDLAAAMLEEGWDPHAVMARKEPDGSIRLSGTALFQHGRMVARLDEAGTRGFLHMLPGHQIAQLPFPCSDGSRGVARAEGRQVRWQVVQQRGQATGFRAQVRMTAHVPEGTCRGSIMDEAALAAVEQAAEQVAVQEMQGALDVLRQARVDALGLGMRVIRQGGAIPGGLTAWWRVPVRVSASVTLDREGLIIEPFGGR